MAIEIVDFTHEKWWFSIAMLDYQRVSIIWGSGYTYYDHSVSLVPWNPMLGSVDDMTRLVRNTSSHETCSLCFIVISWVGSNLINVCTDVSFYMGVWSNTWHAQNKAQFSLEFPLRPGFVCSGAIPIISSTKHHLGSFGYHLVMTFTVRHGKSQTKMEVQIAWKSTIFHGYVK